MDGIPIGKVGKIVAGKEKGRFLKIVDDSESSGGFLLFTADDREFRQGYDNWAADLADVESYFRAAGWRVEWLE